MKINAQTKKKVIALLSSLFPKAQFYVLGSRPRDAQTDIIDVDIIIDNSKKIEPTLLNEVRALLKALNLPFEIDVLDYNLASEDMKLFIKQFGSTW